jgi:hypothetical protein
MEVLPGNGEFENGRIYSSNGRVVDPETRTLLGAFPGIGFNAAVRPAADLGRAAHAERGNVARPRCKVGHLFRFRTAKKHHKNSLHLAYFTKFAQPAQVFMPHNNTLVHNCAIVTYSYGCR